MTGPTAAEPDTERVRVLIYRGLADSGRAPGPADLAAELGVGTTGIRRAIRSLAEQRHLVLDPDDHILMAHPFATVPLGFSVMGAHTLWWGGCAWDSFAVPHLLPDEPAVLVATRCPTCGRPHAWSVDDRTPPPGDQVAHFLVPVARMWDDVVFTCGNQRIFCDAGCVERWLALHELERGYLMDLTTLWRLASHWYDGRLAFGYTRRDPTSAAEYLRSVGLTGPFWGL